MSTKGRGKRGGGKAQKKSTGHRPQAAGRRKGKAADGKAAGRRPQASGQSNSPSATPRSAHSASTLTPHTSPLTPRIGLGYDSHRFAPGGPLILGGVSIPVEFSLIGHSDGDAAAHAVTDAVLGAAALGDIGEMFSDQASENAGRNSIEMLREAVARVGAHGWRVVNCDVTVITETPRLAEYRDGMRAALAGALGIEATAVSVKGKTNERMGGIGRGEGLACMAIVSLLGGAENA